MKVYTAKHDLWCRPVRYSPTIGDSETGRILVPFQICHAFEVGAEAKQDPLNSPSGELDVRVEFPAPVHEQWDFKQAVDFCVSEFSSIKGKSDGERRRTLFAKTVHLFEGFKVHQIVVGPTKAIAAEIRVSSDRLQEIMSDQRKDEAFALLEFLAWQCLTMQNMSCQPAAFQRWAAQVFSGEQKRQRTPTRIKALYERDFVFSLISTLLAHGLKLHRPDKAIEESAADAVAIAARKTGAIRLRGYDGALAAYKAMRPKVSTL